MSLQYYAVDTPRTLDDANHAVFVEGYIHPNRTLPFHDFIYIVNGEWELWQEGVAYTVSSGDVLLLHAGRHHYGLHPCSPGTRTSWLHFHPVAGDAFGEATHDDAVSLPPVIHCQHSSTVKQLFADVISTYLLPEKQSAARISVLLNLLILELDRCQKQEMHKEDALATTVARLIQQNPHIHYSLQQLADIHFVNGKTLDRHFRRVYHKSIFAYQNELKLTAIQRDILNDPHITLRALARNYGFYDEYHLSKAFKQLFGVSPSYYRKN